MNERHRILVPLDFSGSDAALLEQAWQRAVQHDSEVHLIHVCVEPSLFATAVGPADDRVAAAEAALGRLHPPKPCSNVHVTYGVLTGSASAEIIQYAKQHAIDVIVIGTQGRSGLARAVLGSVAEQVLRTAPCPVLAVRSGRQGSASQTELPTESAPATLAPSLELIRRAQEIRATDVHIDPNDGDYLVRVRIDGRLQRFCEFDRDVAGHLIRQLKNFAAFDITEPFRPQEGRLRLPSEFSELEVRLTTAPVMGGIAASLRLLTRANLFHSLETLGFTSHARAQVERMSHRRDGLVIVTGPTNAGKTTTVYALLAALSSDENQIVSIEDPVEIDAPFVRQLEVDEGHGVTMNQGLKTMLRMDPDVVFLGEIRDSLAAETAMRAASSGRHVLSTMHTRDVASTVTAVTDLDIDRRSLAGNLSGIINQRLVRQVCPHCATSHESTPEEKRFFLERDLDPPSQLMAAPGCKSCRETGYLGRLGVFETLVVDAATRQAIVDGLAEAEFRRLIRGLGSPDLVTDALDKAAEGTTTLHEALHMQWVPSQGAPDQKHVVSSGE